MENYMNDYMNDAPLSAPQTMIGPDGSIYAMNDNMNDAPLSGFGGMMRNARNKKRPLQTALPDPYSARVKIFRLSERMGVPGLKKGQVTNRAIYHAVQLGTSASTISNGTQLIFFQNLNSVAFPYSNINQNTFTAQECLIVQRVNFFVWTVVSGNITKIQTIQQFQEGLNASTWSLFITGQQVIKQYSNVASQCEFNPRSKFGFNYASGVNDGQSTIYLEAEPGITPNREFQVNLQLPGATLPTLSGATYYIGCVLEGLGTIPAVEGTL
jgi:hypothetical protein